MTGKRCLLVIRDMTYVLLFSARLASRLAQPFLSAWSLAPWHFSLCPFLPRLKAATHGSLSGFPYTIRSRITSSPFPPQAIGKATVFPCLRLHASQTTPCFASFPVISELRAGHEALTRETAQGLGRMKQQENPKPLPTASTPTGQLAAHSLLRL